MAAKDADALDCDFAETYGVYDREALPLNKAAALATGLSPDSRIKRKIAGQPCGLETQLMALMADRLTDLVWAKTKDAQKGRGRPKSILGALLNGPQTRRTESLAFDTPEDFERARREIIGC